MGRSSKKYCANRKEKLRSPRFLERPGILIGRKIAYFAAPNGKIRKDGLELYYKVTGDLAPQKLKLDVDDLDEIPEEELDGRLDETDEIASRFKMFALPLIRKTGVVKRKTRKKI